MAEDLSSQDKATIAREHDVQLGMLDKLHRALDGGESSDELLKIVDELISYTEVHFMSEQLIMRQHSFEGLNEHEEEHDMLMERLLNMKQEITGKMVSIDQLALNELKRLLGAHLATQDKRLNSFLASRNSPL